MFSFSLTFRQLRPAILFLVIAGIAILVLENKAIDPWGIFVPKQFVSLVFALIFLEFIGYLASRFTTSSTSSWIIGFLGGIVSSTAVVFSSSRRVRSSQTLWKQEMIVVLSSQLAAQFFLWGILAIVSWGLARVFMPIIIVTSIILMMAVVWFHIGLKRSPIEQTFRSPMDIWSVCKMAFTLGIMMVVVTLMQKLVGYSGTIVVAFLAGIFELHSIGTATATLHEKQIMPLYEASDVISVALVSSYLSKIALSFMGTRSQFTWYLTGVLSILVLAVVTVHVLYM